MANVKDPVCGMTVDSDTAADFTTYLGSTYYFCSRDCLKQFAAHPEQFLNKRVPESAWTGKHRSAGKPQGWIGPKFEAEREKGPPER